MSTWLLRKGTGLFFVMALAFEVGQAQAPKNLQVLPSGISRDSLMGIMRGFSFALGVRCQYCHVGGDGVSFEGVEFEKDDDPDKKKARFMLMMVEQLNNEKLSRLPYRDDPPVRIECKTCHRGRPRPMLLKQELTMIIDQAGVDSAVARYKELREGATLAGMFDFREWETNTLAEDLAKGGKLHEAIAIYRLNEEYFDKSVSIKLDLARLYEEVGDIKHAMSYYEKVLALNPEHKRARERLESLQKGKE